MNLASYVKTATYVITANSPVLLLGTTIAGVVTTGVLAAKAGWNARGIVDEAQAERDSYETSAPLTTQEIVRLTWPCYTLPALSASGSIAAAIGGHAVLTKRASAVAALYAVTSNRLDDLTTEAEKALGPKKTQQLQNDVAQKQIDRNPFDENTEVMITSNGDELCYDDWSGRYFTGSFANLESAINNINRLIIDNGDASLNDFYEYVGLPPIPMGNSFGWSGGSKVEGRFGSVTAKDGRLAHSIWFHEAPKENMGCP